MTSITGGVAAQDPVTQAQMRVLYAGDITLARPQFASTARHLTLVPITDVIGSFGGRTVVADIDVAVIDCAYPGVNAAQVVSQLRALRPAMAIVLVIDPGVENGASMALSLQVDDYTVKTPGWLTRLPLRLQLVANRGKRQAAAVPSAQLADRLKATVERAPVCLTRILEDGSVAAMNDAALGMLSLDSLEDVLKKPLATFVAAADHQPLKEFVSTVCGGESRSVELSVATKDGSERIVEARGVALPRDAQGRLSAIVALRDLSDRRKLEASVVDVSEAEVVIDTNAHEALSAEIDELRRRLTEADHQHQQLTHQRDTERQAAIAAVAETALVKSLLAEREQASAGHAELERASHELRARAGEAMRLLEEERARAAEAIRLLDAERARADEATRLLDDERRHSISAALAAVTELDAERQRAGALQGRIDELQARIDELQARLDEEERRHFVAVAARDTDATRVTELSAECAALRAALDEQSRATAADRDSQTGRLQEIERVTAAERQANLRRIEDLERQVRESSGLYNALEEERKVRAMAAARIIDLERRIAEEGRTAEGLRRQYAELAAERQRSIADLEQQRDRHAAAAAQALDAHAAEIASARASLAQAIEDREALRSALHAERERLQAIPTLTRQHEEVMREQASTIEKQLSTITEQAGTIAAQNSTIAEQTSAIAMHTSTIEKQTSTIAEQTSTIAEHTNTIADQTGTIEKHTGTIATQSDTIETLTALLRAAEATCERLAAERDQREQVASLHEAEVRQFVEIRRSHRQELIAALNDAQKYEELAARHLDRCNDLERRLRAAKLEFDELTAWAAIRAARVNEGLV